MNPLTHRQNFFNVSRLVLMLAVVVLPCFVFPAIAVAALKVALLAPEQVSEKKLGDLKVDTVTELYKPPTRDKGSK